jgi:hypothetical protein
VGELLLETDTANRHVERSIDRRYGRGGGTARGEGGKGGEGGEGGAGGDGGDGGEGGEGGGRMFSTRDIVRVLTRGPPSPSPSP